MKHPTKEAVIKIASVFEELASTETNKVQMSRVNIERTECGTVACHAGWYAFNHLSNKFKWHKYHELDEREFLSAIDRHISWRDGSDLIAKDLGFTCMSDVEKWAEENPDIWGNENGKFLFSSNSAFGCSRNKKVTLVDIANHWKGVAERLPA